MRLWHYALLKYLPDAQFKGQLRELVAILHDWKKKGSTNHLLINKVMEYPKNDLIRYFVYYEALYHERYGKMLPKQWAEFKAFDDGIRSAESGLFPGWHNNEYLCVCVCNLYEKYRFGVGKSKITQTEWDRILQGYKNITGEDYSI